MPYESQQPTPKNSFLSQPHRICLVPWGKRLKSQRLQIPRRKGSEAATWQPKSIGVPCIEDVLVSGMDLLWILRCLQRGINVQGLCREHIAGLQRLRSASCSNWGSGTRGLPMNGAICRFTGKSCFRCFARVENESETSPRKGSPSCKGPRLVTSDLHVAHETILVQGDVRLYEISCCITHSHPRATIFYVSSVFDLSGCQSQSSCQTAPQLMVWTMATSSRWRSL